MNRYPFQHAVLRYVHDVVTEEFLNIGVVIYSKQVKYLKCMVSNRYGRLSKTFSGIERLNYTRMVSVVERKVEQLGSQLSQATLFDDFPNRIEDFLPRVLIPNDASLRFGGIGGGMTSDLDLELEKLYMRLVEKYLVQEEPESRTDDQVWSIYAQSFSQHSILEHLAPVRISTSTYAYDFSYAYKNENWHPIEPVSLDLVHPRSISDKAHKWIGNATVLTRSDEIGTLYLLLGAPKKRALHEAYENAIIDLETALSERDVRVVREENAQQFSEEFSRFIHQHLSQ